MEILENDLEVFQQRATLAEKENDGLREQIRVLENNLCHVDPGRIEDSVQTTLKYSFNFKFLIIWI